MAWTIMSFLVIPILVIDRKGPITAFKESTALLKRTWGEQVAGSFSFGLIFFLLNIPAFLLIVLGFFLGTSTAIIACIGIVVIYFIVLALIQSTLQSIFQAALYLYARDGQVAGFENELLRTAVVSK